MNAKMKFFSYNGRYAHSPAVRSDEIDLFPVAYFCGDVFLRHPRHPGVMVFSIIAHADVPDSLLADPLDGYLCGVLPGDQCRDQLFFAPEYGVSIYGTRHEFARVFGMSLTYEQLFYQVTKIFKYASVVPLGMIFLLTTNPSEFASSLNRIGVNYKAAIAVALTLRYFPDIQRDYRDINLSQQARGLEMSKKAKLADRFKNSLLIIIPLIFSTWTASS
jgi:energy-coupling factor transporter transmembrane protein EcfT